MDMPLPTPSGATRPTLGAIDCDIHPAVPNTLALLPYMDEYWRDILSGVIVGVDGGIGRMELASYPPGAPLSARPDWRPAEGRAGASLAAMQSHALDHFGLRFAICNVLHGAQAAFSPYFGAALCRAINDWVVAEWLDRDPRLRASIVVSMVDPALAIAASCRCWFWPWGRCRWAGASTGRSGKWPRATACRSAFMPAACIATPPRRAGIAPRWWKTTP